MESKDNSGRGANVGSPERQQKLAGQKPKSPQDSSGKSQGTKQSSSRPSSGKSNTSPGPGRPHNNNWNEIDVAHAHYHATKHGHNYKDDEDGNRDDLGRESRRKTTKSKSQTNKKGLEYENKLHANAKTRQERIARDNLVPFPGDIKTKKKQICPEVNASEEVPELCESDSEANKLGTDDATLNIDKSDAQRAKNFNKRSSAEDGEREGYDGMLEMPTTEFGEFESNLFDGSAEVPELTGGSEFSKKGSQGSADERKILKSCKVSECSWKSNYHPCDSTLSTADAELCKLWLEERKIPKSCGASECSWKKNYHPCDSSSSTADAELCRQWIEERSKTKHDGTKNNISIHTREQSLNSQGTNTNHANPQYKTSDNQTGPQNVQNYAQSKLYSEGSHKDYKTAPQNAQKYVYSKLSMEGPNKGNNADPHTAQNAANSKLISENSGKDNKNTQNDIQSKLSPEELNKVNKTNQQNAQNATNSKLSSEKSDQDRAGPSQIDAKANSSLDEANKANKRRLIVKRGNEKDQDGLLINAPDISFKNLTDDEIEKLVTDMVETAKAQKKNQHC